MGLGMSEGHYVVGEAPGGRPVLLLGPYASARGAASQVERARRGHRRAHRSAYGWQYGTQRATAQGGRPLPAGSLNRALGLWPLAEPDDIAEEPEPAPEPVKELEWRALERPTDANGVSAVPYVRARFRHARLLGWDGEPMLCQVTRVSLTDVWFRPIRADGSLGDSMRAEWGAGGNGGFENLIGEWQDHPTMRGRANAPSSEGLGAAGGTRPALDNVVPPA